MIEDVPPIIQDSRTSLLRMFCFSISIIGIYFKLASVVTVSLNQTEHHVNEVYVLTFKLKMLEEGHRRRGHDLNKVIKTLEFNILFLPRLIFGRQTDLAPFSYFGSVFYLYLF